MPKKKPENKPAWNPSKRIRAFLSAYQETASIVRAAEAAGIDRSAHYRQMERSPEYRKAFARAEVIAADSLEAEAIRRAKEGVVRPLIYHGRLVQVLKDPRDPASEVITLTETEYSDSVLVAALKARHPRWREKVEIDATVKAKKFDGSLEELLAIYRDMSLKGDEE